MKPSIRPEIPRFSSGPTTKRPGWSVDGLTGATLGRSHRSGEAKAKLQKVIDQTRSILAIPDDYRIGILPASDTGAFECAMWSMLGARPVDLLAWESFGKSWVTDAVKQLKLADTRVLEADYGEIADLSAVNPASDVVFTWNGTTSGVRVPDGDWIRAERSGLTLCDATSAVFALPMDWRKLDVTTWSWQKVLGGEAQHGMMVLSPRAVERLESYQPPWPLPKIFRLTKGGKLVEGPFIGETINTPSMLAVEDVLDSLAWVEREGGLDGMIRRTHANLAVLEEWVSATSWVEFLAKRPEIRSPTSICLKIVDPLIASLSPPDQLAFVKTFSATLANEGVAYDVAGHRDAPPGLRIWGGATVERRDLEALMPWLDWAYVECSRSMAA